MMTAHNIPRENVRDGVAYLLSKRDQWWRPGGNGYTTDLAAAGVYVGADARSRVATAQDVVAAGAFSVTTAVPLSTMAARISGAINSLRAKQKTIEGQS